MGRERPFVQDWRFTARVRTISWTTYSEAAERLALTLSTRPGNTPEPPPPKLRAPGKNQARPARSKLLQIG